VDKRPVEGAICDELRTEAERYRSLAKCEQRTVDRIDDPSSPFIDGDYPGAKGPALARKREWERQAEVREKAADEIERLRAIETEARLLVEQAHTPPYPTYVGNLNWQPLKAVLGGTP
jgi:hypothetical protein